MVIYMRISMRELKFRVWYENVRRGEKKGEEIVWSVKSYYDYSPIIDNGGLLEVDGGWDIYGNSDENYVIEQYTGLKDKNGKEIYEGDIVRTKFVGVEPEKWVIGWDISLCRFGYFHSYDRILEGHWSDHDLKVIDYRKQPLEIIGNIHENPELLEN